MTNVTEFCSCNVTKKVRGCSCERCLYCGKYIIAEYIEDHKVQCFRDELERF